MTKKEVVIKIDIRLINKLLIYMEPKDDETMYGKYFDYSSEDDDFQKFNKENKITKDDLLKIIGTCISKSYIQDESVNVYVVDSPITPKSSQFRLTDHGIDQVNQIKKGRFKRLLDNAIKEIKKLVKPIIVGVIVALVVAFFIKIIQKILFMLK